MPRGEARGMKGREARESQSCGGERGSRERVKGRPGHSGAGILFPLLESPELALDCKGSLLCLWRCQVNVDFFLFLGLLDAARFPCRQLETNGRIKPSDSSASLQTSNTALTVHFQADNLRSPHPTPPPSSQGLQMTNDSKS